MPAETHQCGNAADRDEIAVLLLCLLGEDAGDTTLASLGVDDAALSDLWDAVREEFGERTLGPAEAMEMLDCTMSIDATAAAMSTLLARGGGIDEVPYRAGANVDGEVNALQG